MSESVAQRLGMVRRRIDAACDACGRDRDQVELLAVSKTRPAEEVRAASACGQRSFGENRVQELVKKAAELADLPVEWHLIGSLQTNKVRDVVSLAELVLVHSVDRQKLADKLEQACAEVGRRLPVLMQINATGEEQKHGVAPEHAAELARHVVERCPHLELRGVMGMGPLSGDPGPAFATIAALRERLRVATDRPLPVLSLGMTADLEAAVAAGSTLVRVGTGVFGPRG